MRYFKPSRRIRFLCLCLLLGVVGCREQRQAQSPPKEIARVGDVSISQDAFEALLNMRARGTSDRLATTAAKEALLDEMIRREAVFAKAKAAGFDQRPDIQESVKRLIAAKFQDEQTQPQGANEPSVSEQEIGQYYQQHKDKYATSAKVRGAILFLKVSPLAEAEEREQLMAKAQALLAQAKAAAPRDFAQLVQANSEDQATRYKAGDIGWVSREAKGLEPDPAVIAALFTLQKPGDIAPLVPTKKGVYIVKLTDTQAVGTRPLAEVKESIAYMLRKQKQEQQEQEFFAAMKAGLDIRINRPLLESIQPSPSPVKTPPGMPGAAPQMK
jgi:parvulin-like peptidyl-prolyl isomerase